MRRSDVKWFILGLAVGFTVWWMWFVGSYLGLFW